MRLVRVLGLGVLVLAFGCGSDDGAGKSASTLSHDFPPVHVGPYGEIADLCQSWTLNNPEPVWVHAVRAHNDGRWHHSNWFFVPDALYSAADGGNGDGTWTCADRAFSELAAGVSGGVLFAQSTQSLMDVQEFLPGHAFRLPPNARIVGDIHLLNLSDAEIDSAQHFSIETMAPEDVEVPLQPMAYFNRAIELPPHATSSFTMTCDFGSPQDFNVEYVMPHYHALGREIRLELVGGSRDGEVIFDSTGTTGEAWGRTLDPPENMGGATALKFTCVFENPRDQVVKWGIGDQEMCVFLAYTDDAYKHAGQTTGVNTSTGTVDGVETFDNPCDLTSFAAPNPGM